MIDEIRSYIATRVKSLLPSYTQSKVPFDNETIPETKIDKTFIIQFGSMSNFLRSEYFEFDLECNIQIFRFGFRNEVANFDEGYRDALCIMENITDLANLELDAVIINAVPSTLDVEQLPENNNLYKYNINVTLRIAYEK